MKYLLVLATLVCAAVLVAHFTHGTGDGGCPANQRAYNGGC